MSRIAKSLAVLRDECNAIAPNRSKTLDGWLGDKAPQARVSRHNPYQGVVCALDITHDPAHGLDCQALFDRLREYPHPNLEYLIHNRQVARRRNGWAVERYTGSHPHDGHMHVAVGHGTDGAPFASLTEVDNTDPWGLEDDMTDAERALLKEAVLYGKHAKLSDVARSHDMEIIKAMIAGEFEDRIDALEAQKAEAVAETRRGLGL
jgi:hypothetical protein